MKPLILPIAALLVLSNALASERYVTVATNGAPSLSIVDVSAGGVVDRNVVQLGLQVPTGVNLGTAQIAAQVGSELWVGTSTGVARFDAQTFAFQGQALLPFVVRTIEPTSTGALVLSGPDLYELDFQAAGAPVARLFSVSDIRPFGTGYLVARSGELERLDAQFRFVETFDDNVESLATAAGTNYSADRIVTLRNGNIAVVASVSIAVIDPSGVALAVYNPGLFERDLIELPGGGWLVNTASGLTIFDPATGTSNTARGVLDDYVGGRFHPVSTGQPSTSSRYCTGAVNSTGQGASIFALASRDLSDATLRLYATSLPPASVCLPIFGQAASNLAFGDGRLCISPAQGGVIRSALVPSQPDGTAWTELSLSGQGQGGQFMSGSTWNFQMLYRDAAGPLGTGFNATDAISVTWQ